MDAQTKIRITAKLKVFLNRDPLESEVLNSENDPIVRGWLRDEDIAQKQDKIKI